MTSARFDRSFSATFSSLLKLGLIFLGVSVLLCSISFLTASAYVYCIWLFGGVHFLFNLNSLLSSSLLLFGVFEICFSLIRLKKSFKYASAISFIIFWDFLIFYQIFLSPQAKRWAIVTYKHGIYEFPHELPNDLRLRILGNYETLGKCPNPIEW